MKKILSARYPNGILLALLVVASALIYLPRLSQIGYLNDDWYLMYSAHAYGPQVFTDIYSIDRPARALILMPAYALFGDNPFYYNLSAYVLRVISAISFLWLLQMLWPRQRTPTFIAALLFLIYPGFLSQINGIDYQSQMVSLAAAMLSIALSVKAALSRNLLATGIASILAILLGLFYLGLVEYFLGLELLRFASLYLLASRSQVSWREKIRVGVLRALPGLIVSVVFLVWRVFLFESERGATDIGSQLAQFKESPLVTGIWWLVHLLSNTFHVTFLAWGAPIYQFLSYISRLRDLFIASAAVGVLLLLIFWFIQPFEDDRPLEPGTPDWRLEALLLGLGTALAGLVPVILVNRQADFGDFSRYTLASSAGSALVLASLLFFLSARAVRWGIFSLLLTAAVFTHHANTIRVVNETASLRAFWWQVAWRVPHLKMGTTLVVNYPITTIQEDYFVWGPANLIYYPTGIADDQIRPGVSAAVLNKDTLLKIVGEHRKENNNRRSIRTVIDYQNILVLSMPTQASCVQVVDGNNVETSQFEEERMMVILPYSDITNVDLDSESPTPPEIVFGPEPPHSWCYYYEKADLARQRGDWDEVLRLGNEVLKNDFMPMDDIEWMPFLQAYARAGDSEGLDKIHRLMKNSDPFVVRQACQSIGSIPGLSEPLQKTIQSSYCAE